MNKIRIIALFGIGIFLFIVGAFLWYQSQAKLKKAMVQQDKVATPSVKDQQANIQVTSLSPNQNLTLPFSIVGKARVFENQLRYRILECDGKILDEGILSAQSPDIDQYGPFAVSIGSLPEIQGKSGCIEVFSNSPKDGAEINMVTVPVMFDLTNTMPVKIYFGGKQAPKGEECTAVYPVVRNIVKTKSAARASLEELLRGTMAIEKNRGYFTSINRDVKLQNLTIVDGVARADFDTSLEKGVGGSCKITAIRRQITETLKQFPTVKSVVLSIDGRAEGILQP